MWITLFLTLLQSPDVPTSKKVDGQKPVQTTTIPFENLSTRHMAVRIMVNGKGPYRVIFDTGAPISLIGSKIHKEANLGKGKDGMPFLFGMQGTFKLKDLKVGDLNVEGAQVIVMDHPTVKAISDYENPKGDDPILGILGFPFFAKFRTALDYQAKTLTLTPTTYEPGDIMQDLMKSMMGATGGNKKKPPRLVIDTPALWGWDVAKTSEDEEEGVEITHVFAGSAVEAAGIKVGDRLVELNGNWTDSVMDCRRAASHIKADQTVNAKIKRGDNVLTKQITPRLGG